jgi:hypothetical protein
MSFIHNGTSPTVIRAIKSGQYKLALLLLRSPKIMKILTKVYDGKTILEWAIDSAAENSLGETISVFEKDPEKVNYFCIFLNIQII